MNIDYNDGVFRGVENSPGGGVDGDTVLQYRQDGNIVWATYAGGAVGFGTLTDLLVEDGRLDMRYQQVSTTGSIKTGRCISTPKKLPDGRLRLHEAWRWTEGGEGEGRSCVEEVAGCEASIQDGTVNIDEWRGRPAVPEFGPSTR